MSDPQEHSEALERHARKRAAYEEAHPEVHRLMNKLAAGLPRERPQVTDWTCVICGKEYGWAEEDPNKVCSHDCHEALKMRHWSEQPKEKLLRSCGVPPKYTGAEGDQFDLDFHGGAWPADHGGRMDCGAWRGAPAFVTLVGTNGGGKSFLAAEMMFRLIRGSGGTVQRGYWVGAGEIIHEDRELRLGEPRPAMHRAKTTAVLVVDEIGWGPSKTEAGLGMLATLCEHRYHHNRPTIWISHLPLSKGKGPTIKSLAPMIHDRMRDGLLVHIDRPSGRGQ